MRDGGFDSQWPPTSRDPGQFLHSARNRRWVGDADYPLKGMVWEPDAAYFECIMTLEKQGIMEPTVKAGGITTHHV